MRKSISLTIVLLMFISFFTPIIGSAKDYPPSVKSLLPINLNELPKSKGFSHEFLPATSIWKDIVGNVAPAKFNNVNYTLNDNVVLVNNNVVKNIKSSKQIIENSAIQTRPPMKIISEGGFIPKNILESAAQTANIEPNTVFFDKDSGTAFKLVTPISTGEAMKGFENNYSVTKPQIHEIVKDFDLPQQVVTLNKANITGFADSKIEKSIVNPKPLANMAVGSDNFNEFKKLKDPIIEFMFPKDTELKAYLGDGMEVTVKLNGGLGIGDMKLDGRYSCSSGYRIALTMSQEAFMQVDVGVNINREVRIPIIGVEIPFGVGSVAGGLFIVVSIDGTITIELQARQWATTSVGVSGGTFLYIPTYVVPEFDMPDKGITGDVSIDGKVNGTIKAGALLSLELFGWELVGAGAFIGAGLTVASDGTMLDIELYGLVQAYIALLGDVYNLVNFKLTVFNRQQKDMGGYRVKINEACAYQDRVGGIIEYSYGSQGRLPEKDVKFKVRVTPAISSDPVKYGDPVIYEPTPGGYYTTDEYGEFIVYNIPLTMNDKVEILVVDKVDSAIRESGAAKPTFPFKNILVTDADYFNDFVVGQVVPVKSKNWGVHTGKDEDEYKTIYYEGPVTVRLLKRVWGGQYAPDQDVVVQTNSTGNFKADDELTSDGKALDVKPGHRFSTSLIKEGFLVTAGSNIEAKVEFQLKKVSQEVVEGSEKRYTEGNKLIDQMIINERYYIINTRGTKQLTGNNVKYEVLGFSTQDAGSNHSMHWEPLFGSQVGQVKLVYTRAKDSLDSLYPVLNNLQVTPETTDQGIESGTSYLDNKVITEWVWQPHSNPTAITSADQHTCTTDGSTFQVTAKGVTPIHYAIANEPSGVTIDEKTGLMTISKPIKAGKYQFTVIATADSRQYPPDMIFIEGQYPEYREDDYPPVKQDFTLTVTQGTNPESTTSTTTQENAPVITSINHYECTMVGGTFQVTATGKAPIKYSLSSTSPTAGVPQQIKINPDTGLITIVRGLKEGTYKFNINASNGISPNAVQLFTLTVKQRLIQPVPNRVPTDTTLKPMKFAAAPDQNKPGNTQNVPAFSNTTQNTIKLRNDDPRDKYSNDSMWVSGARYVKWDGILTLNIEGVGTRLIFIDRSPVIDHHMRHMTKEEIAEGKKAIEEHIKEKSKTSRGFETSDGIQVNPIDQSTILDYGTILNNIKAQKGGLLSVLLDSKSGTLVPGEVFAGLKEKPGAKMMLSQQGATITFASGDIGNVNNTALFDFAFSKTAPNASAMMQGAGGGNSFTYSFAHNGKMPGYAEFSIDTGMTEGTTVNVYKYEAEAGKFSLIAGNIKVTAGGKVNYKNNTTSEYIITTQNISGADVSEAYRYQGKGADSQSRIPFWTVIGGVLVLLLVIGGILIVIIRKKIRKASENIK